MQIKWTRFCPQNNYIHKHTIPRNREAGYLKICAFMMNLGRERINEFHENDLGETGIEVKQHMVSPSGVLGMQYQIFMDVGSWKHKEVIPLRLLSALLKN